MKNEKEYDVIVLSQNNMANIESFLSGTSNQKIGKTKWGVISEEEER